MAQSGRAGRPQSRQLSGGKRTRAGGANYILKPESKNKVGVASPMLAMLRSVVHLPV
jgi:hypothetical protein